MVHVFTPGQRCNAEANRGAGGETAGTKTVKALRLGQMRRLLLLLSPVVAGFVRLAAVCRSLRDPGHPVLTVLDVSVQCSRDFLGHEREPVGDTCRRRPRRRRVIVHSCEIFSVEGCATILL